MYTYICVYVYMCIYVDICTYIHIYIYIYTYTYRCARDTRGPMASSSSVGDKSVVQHNLCTSRTGAQLDLQRISRILDNRFRSR